MKTINAKVSSTFLGIGRGHLTACLHLAGTVDGISFNVGFGLQAFDGSGRDDYEEKRGRYGIAWIRSVLKVLGSDRWEQLEGQVLRVLLNDKLEVQRIGHVLEDQWFDPVALHVRVWGYRPGEAP